MGAHALPPLRILRNVEYSDRAAEIHPVFPMLIVQGSYETIDGQSVQDERRKANRTREGEKVLDSVLIQDRTICLASKCVAIPVCAVTAVVSRLLLIDIKGGDKVFPLGEPVFELHFLEGLRSHISPAELPREAVPNPPLRRVGPEPSRKTPFENLHVTLAKRRLLNKLIMSDAQKAAKVAVQTCGQAEMRPILIGKLAAQVESNLIHHSTKVI
jgi:hypothetical protein